MQIKDILYKQKNNPKIAVEYCENKISYIELFRKVSEHKNIISEICTNINNIGIFLPNSIDYVIGYFAIAFIDKVIVPLEITNKQRQISSIVDYCELGVIITNTENISTIKQFLDKFKFNTYLYNLDTKIYEKVGNNKELIISEELNRNINEENVAIMLHTSGTTSLPKKVMLTHKNLISNINSNIKSLRLNENDKCLIVLPMFFGYCNSSQFLTHLYLGASIVIYDSVFVPDKFLRYIAKKKCTNTTCVPSMLFLVTKKRNTKYYLDSLRYLCFGGGIMPIGKLKEIIDYFPHTGIAQTYGQTEASPRVTCLLPEDSLRKIGSVGKAIPDVSIRVIDENNNDVRPDEIGEIIVKGNNVMKGYYKREDETKRVLKNGWLHTGDLGKLDEEGYLYIVGRIKNIIINGGLNIYPEEIEELLINYHGIKEVIVTSQNHDLLGEVPIAKIVLEQGYKITEYEIIKYCSENLEKHKVPSKIIFLEQLEKTYTGKVKRN